MIGFVILEDGFPRSIRFNVDQALSAISAIRQATSPTAQVIVTFTGTGSQLNAEAVRFTFTAAAGTYTHVGLFDAATGGNPLTWSALSQAAVVSAAGTVAINPAGLVVTPA